ncbi:MAG TPA: hypothetical protein VHW66_07640 [Stellaceae bacterium]|jgi:hypothetical protein|nr:hypothetical protein [Stellaceae bacterium]
MTFDDIPRPDPKDAPVVSRIEPKPQATPAPREAKAQEERAPADAEPHFPRIFPGI